MGQQVDLQQETIQILVVDDEPFILRSLSHLLTREGYRVETARDGEEALGLLPAIRPPLVFLDVMMPRASGYEVCKRIREDPVLSGTYVIMLSARGQRTDMEQGLSCGADEYITKPFSPQHVAQRAHALLRAGNAEGSAA